MRGSYQVAFIFYIWMVSSFTALNIEDTQISDKEQQKNGNYQFDYFNQQLQDIYSRNLNKCGDLYCDNYQKCCDSGAFSGCCSLGANAVCCGLYCCQAGNICGRAPCIYPSFENQKQIENSKNQQVQVLSKNDSFLAKYIKKYVKK
ncbi:hypothetical protein PPERSA_10831 [Pseudocohnilembus persalinus]|uniref:Uncharacterized protein n=1 Tax=Pseudocohnilembus persalinus TaxID=266149 RepID=A0A0V0QDR9_PSEPJ|nr:hypothetical protein PPERSA_10831 [Pseudocohnilembus persalinus]|eukprot:KRX00332.1 hypothetical protein PPERSA_10831 [Pseudocohnilembus persalinus]